MARSAVALACKCIDPVAFFSVDKHRFGRHRFEREIYSPAGGARPMDSSRWYYNALPWSECQTASVSDVYFQRSLHNEEQLVRIRMMMPPVGAVKYGEPQTTRVDAAKHHIAVLARDRTLLGGDIEDLERRVADGLVGVRVGRGEFSIHRSAE
jgi:hypothetical protein